MSSQTLQQTVSVTDADTNVTLSVWILKDAEVSLSLAARRATDWLIYSSNHNHSGPTLGGERADTSELTLQRSARLIPDVIQYIFCFSQLLLMMVSKGGQSQLITGIYTHTGYSAWTLVFFSLDCGRKLGYLKRHHTLWTCKHLRQMFRSGIEHHDVVFVHCCCTATQVPCGFSLAREAKKDLTGSFETALSYPFQ